MKFFLPFWFSDHVYDSYDPWQYEWRPERAQRRFVWQLPWPRLPIDGILISRSNIEKTKSRLQEFNDKGIYETLGLPGHLPTFGDCGAWGYIRDRTPPYQPEETLEFYRRMKFTYACTVDHIILPETFPQRYERLEITLRNAQIMADEWKSDPTFYGFQLAGVVQGWDPQSYYDSAKKILDMGFKFIALGGQSRAPSTFTADILRRCYPLWKDKDVKVHIFGLGRWNLFDAFRQYGVHSFDNAYHRRAWLSLSHNYEIEAERYTAIRIPVAKEPDERKMERRVWERLRELDDEKTSVSSFLKTLRSYDSQRYEMLGQEYERTLVERPWKRCDCIICKTIGIHVVVFRSNERNMRRGFHNLWNLYKRLSSGQSTSEEQQVLLPVVQS
jgi:hypothetical protein